jgi:hypothetical protein
VLVPGLGAALVGLTCLALALRRATTARQQAEVDRLRSALDAANLVARESMELALASTALRLGPFLHELRNSQCVAVTNLQFVARDTSLSAAQREALEDVTQAHLGAADLIRRAVEDLRQRAGIRSSPFGLGALAQGIAATETAPGLRVVVEPGCALVQILGEPERLRVALNALLRTARRKGARVARVRASPDASGAGVTIEVVSDDPPSTPGASGALTRPWPGTEGDVDEQLELLLAERSVDLMGGRAERYGSTAFRMHLPGLSTEAGPGASAARVEQA